MFILQVRHTSADYEGWKATFDSDPIGRAARGVRHHRVLRAVDDPKFVSIDLTFETAADARALLIALTEMWQKVDGSLIFDPQAQIFEVTEDQAY